MNFVGGVLASVSLLSNPGGRSGFANNFFLKVYSPVLANSKNVFYLSGSVLLHSSWSVWEGFMSWYAVCKNVGTLKIITYCIPTINWKIIM